MATTLTFPGGKRFAFTICDDTDMARVETVAPVYRLLENLGIRAAKSVWPLASSGEESVFGASQTLEDDEYRAFALDLQGRGFEITMHGASMISSPRERTLLALERFRAVFGSYPRVHTNHGENRDNLYWGPDRVDDPLLGLMLRRSPLPADHYQGHVTGSHYWWGDLCQSRITYVRNLVFDTIDVRAINPTLPYHDPSRPLVRWWFSAANADDVHEFNRLISSERQERLERRGGVCIVATHLGKHFFRNGHINAECERLLGELASRRGWFPNLSELLDYLREELRTDRLGRSEWLSMQWTWMRDLIRQKWAARRRHHARRRQTRMAAAAGSRSG